jgi:hypothetical protein
MSDVARMSDIEHRRSSWHGQRPAEENHIVVQAWRERDEARSELAFVRQQLAGAVERASKMYEGFVAERRMLREALAEYGETDEKLAARYAALRGQ